MLSSIHGFSRDVATLFDNALDEAIPNRIIAYKTIGETTLNLHVFESETPPKAVILWIHGGGWQGGEPAQLYPHSEYFKTLGFTCISAEYRLATGGNTVFDCINDSRDAFYYIVEHAEEFNISTDRIIVAGESAGGHLAAVVGYIPDLREGIPDPQPVPAACLLINAMLDIPAISWTIGKPGITSIAIAESISPSEFVDANDPPALLLHGADDTVVLPEQSVGFAASLQELGIAANLQLWEGKTHAFFLYLPVYNLTDKPIIHHSLLEIEAFLQAERFNGYPVVDGHFSPVHLFAGPDGWRSFSELVPIGNDLFGSTYNGGPDNKGTLFKFSPATRKFALLHTFDGTDGREVFNGLAVDGTTIYGVCKFEGSTETGGTLWKIQTDGSGFSILHEFPNGSTSGFYPHSAPILQDGNLYGTVYHGGSTTWGGALYKFTLPSGPYEVIHSFKTDTGRHPAGQLIPVGDWLYGTATDFFHHDDGYHGSIYRIHKTTHEFDLLHTFTGTSDGGHPYDKLYHDGAGNLFGTTFGQAFNPLSKGTIFKYSIPLESFSIIHDFGSTPGTGSKPNGSLISIDSSGFLYGVSHGSNGSGGEIGTLFRLKADGSDFSILHRFDSGLIGNTPMRSLVYHQGAFYGISVFGGLTTDVSNPETGGGFIFRYEPVSSPSSARSALVDWLVDNQLLVNQSLENNSDKDFLSLIEEFAFGGLPLVPDTINPLSLMPVTGSLIQFQAQQVRAEMSDLVQPKSSTTMEDWLPASGFSYQMTNHATAPGYKVLTWQWPDSVLSGSPFFLKLETRLE